MEPKLEKAIIGSGVSCLIVGGLAGLVSAANATDAGNSTPVSVAVCTAVAYSLNRKSGMEYTVVGVVFATTGYNIGYYASRFAYDMMK